MNVFTKRDRKAVSYWVIRDGVGRYFMKKSGRRFIFGIYLGHAQTFLDELDALTYLLTHKKLNNHIFTIEKFWKTNDL